MGFNFQALGAKRQEQEGKEIMEILGSKMFEKWK